MSAESNRALVKRFYDLLQQQNYAEIAELCHEDFAFYSQVDTPFYGAKGLIEAEKKNFEAFPDFQFPIKALFVDGDQAATYMTFEGTHSGGEYAGIPATGKRIRISIMQYLRIKDGKILEKRAHIDKHDILKQLDVQH
ncbi:hypothetical protein D9M68_197290 [compost metagenome]